jgi:hypothetical protein
MIIGFPIHTFYSKQTLVHEMSSRRDSDFARLEQLLQEERRNRQEADERAKEAEERAELPRRRAEDERRRAEGEQRNRQEAESRAQIERKKTRPTTFEEYIRACHALLSKPLRIQTDKSLSTQCSITSPKNKPCPTEPLYGRGIQAVSQAVGLQSTGWPFAS